MPLSFLALTEVLTHLPNSAGLGEVTFPMRAVLRALGTAGSGRSQRWVPPPCGSGATDRISPPQPLRRLNVWHAFFKKAMLECTKAKKCVFDPNLNRETKVSLWRFMPQVVHSHFLLVFSLPCLGKRKKSLKMCTFHRQISYQREKK